MNIIKKTPVPIAGVALGFAALGNLLQSYSNGVRSVCGVFSFLFLLPLIIKVFTHTQIIKEDMKNPITASVAGTVPMTLMLLASYIKPIIGGGAFYLWLFAIALHIALIVYFTITFIMKFDIKKVFAGYFIVYVGIACSAISAPLFERTDIGTITFLFGFVSMLILMPIVGYRYLKHKEIPDSAKPLFCIFTAPLNICIAGYIQSVSNKNTTLLLAMLVCSLVIYVIALIKAFEFLKLPFFPSYAAFTFPFVISAIATKQSNVFLLKAGIALPGISGVVLIQTVIATVFVLYTAYRFLVFLFQKKKA